MWLRFAYNWLFFITVPLFLLLLIYRLKWYRYPCYRFPLIQYLYNQKATETGYHRLILSSLRAVLLFILLLFVARPQWIDEQSQVTVNGVDIMITLDVSGSMELIDDPQQPLTRLEIAKREAINFIKKRHNDPIGIVIFGSESLSRCPLTLDKPILTELIESLSLGIVNPDGTALGTGLATAINRLKSSQAKNKIVILLTDGNPSAEERISPEIAITLAKEFGIKVYTIGIGSESGTYMRDRFFGLVQVSAEQYNKKLLEKIAEETGGKFFQARNVRDMQTIYTTIDNLEKTEHQTAIFHHYYEAFFSFIWAALFLLMLECALRLFIWRGI